MSNIVAKTGNEAMAEAMRQINPDVVAAYPITPATEIVQLFSNFVHDGRVDTEFVAVESEHSALSACVGASTAGARVMTGTSSQGLALMHEILYIASGLRLPIVICEVNRALSSPINIHCDHSDTMGARDSGWMQLYAEDSQEAYDMTIFMMKAAEDIMLPGMVSTDGFIISHAMQRLDMYEDEAVRNYLGERKPAYTCLDTENPITVGPLVLQDYFMEVKRAQEEAVLSGKVRIKELLKEYNKNFEKDYNVIDTHNIDDAEYVIVALGSSAGTAKYVSDKMREEGKKVGVVKPLYFRPFYGEDIVDYLRDKKGVAVLDRSSSQSSMGGPLFTEISSAFYRNEKHPVMKNYLYGLGGRDLKAENVREIFDDIESFAEKNGEGEIIEYITLRE
ncbi:MAG: pyruvate ferredoxin oxidoreductase [candidate division WOR-3 bacterium]|nr:pyruvate ferredoxin oxidoreductase [candidate division WOR-3 bacterium]